MLVDALAKEWSYFFPPGGGKVVYCFLEIMSRRHPRRLTEPTKRPPGSLFLPLPGGPGPRRKSPRPVRDWIRHGPGLRLAQADRQTNKCRAAPSPLE